MLITADTKIGAIINNNPHAIDVLIAVNKHFIKLKNPILRKILAPRVTVTEAAKIGKCSVSLILDGLSSIGFEIKKEDFIAVGETATTHNNTFQPGHDCKLDVRPSLANGADPFNDIMKKVKELAQGQTLLVINSFEPLPLIRILRQKGHTVAVSFAEPDMVHTYITKGSSKSEIAEKADLIADNEMLFGEILTKYTGNLVEIDVRHLEMPQPMITILRSIDRLPEGKALLVHHKKVPVYLLPELKEKNFRHIISQHGAEVKMIIYP